MKTCTSCGTGNPDNAQFCAECGTRLEIPFLAGNSGTQSISTDLPEQDFIPFYCTACGQPIEAPIQLAGEQIDCPSCKKSLTIPLPDQLKPVRTPAVRTPGRVRSRRGLAIIAVGVVVIAAMVVHGIQSRLKILPRGWHRRSFENTGLSISCPPDWKIMTAGEFEHEFPNNAIRYSEGTVICANTEHVNSVGCMISNFQDEDVKRIAATKNSAREFLKRLIEENATGENSDIVSQKIYDFAGGVACEGLIRKETGSARMVRVIANKKMFAFEFDAYGKLFESSNREIFQPMLDSVVIK